MRPNESDVSPIDSSGNSGGEARSGNRVNGGQATASDLEPSGPPSLGPTRTPLLRRPINQVTLPKMWSLLICPTTGGTFSVCIPSNDTVDGLKRILSKRLKIQKDRINLLYKDRLLRDGTLVANSLADHSRVTLLPNVETGLMAQKHDDTVLQALESLTDSQVDDFLTGKSPLTLAMRLGEHMMFVQVQLSISPPGAKTSTGSSNVCARKAASPSRMASMSSVTRPTRVGHGAGVYGRTGSRWSNKPDAGTLFTTSLGQSAPASTSTLLKVPPALSGLNPTPGDCPSSPLPGALAPASPTTLSNSNTSPIPSPTPSPPAVKSPGFPNPQDPPQPKRIGYFFGGNPPVTMAPRAVAPRQAFPLVAPVPIHVRRLVPNSSDHPLTSPAGEPQGHVPAAPQSATPQSATPTLNTPHVSMPTSTSAANLKDRANQDTDTTKTNLQNAKRSLSEKLREFSSQAAPTATRPSSPASAATPALTEDKSCSNKTGRLSPGGAKIESMHHLGQGVFSGTFSGTLNPALQDREGKPKKSISTIIHILNDLLGASPHCQQLGGGGSGAVKRIVGVSPAPPPSVVPTLPRASMPTGCPPREVSDENKATRGKMEQIQSMLEQRRRRRQQRRQTRSSPYSSSNWSQSADDKYHVTDEATYENSLDDQPMDMDDDSVCCDKEEKAMHLANDELNCTDVMSDKEGTDLDKGALAV